MRQLKRQVLVCVGGNCAYDGDGGLEIYRGLRAHLADRGLLYSAAKDEGDVSVSRLLCTIGCGSGPMVVVQPDNVFYGRVSLKDIARIVEEHLVGDRAVNDIYFFRGEASVPITAPEEAPMWAGGPKADHASAPTVTDPVCGMSVDSKTSQPKTQHVHDGTTYFFCSPGCKRAFASAPATYLDPAYRPDM